MPRLVPGKPCTYIHLDTASYPGAVLSSRKADRSPRISREYRMIRCTCSGHGQYSECQPENITELHDSASPAWLVCCLRMSIRLGFRVPVCCEADCAFDELSYPSRRLDDAASDDVSGHRGIRWSSESIFKTSHAAGSGNIIAWFSAFRTRFVHWPRWRPDCVSRTGRQWDPEHPNRRRALDQSTMQKCSSHLSDPVILMIGPRGSSGTGTVWAGSFNSPACQRATDRVRVLRAPASLVGCR